MNYCLKHILFPLPPQEDTANALYDVYHGKAGEIKIMPVLSLHDPSSCGVSMRQDASSDSVFWLPYSTLPHGQWLCCYQTPLLNRPLYRLGPC